MAETSPHRARIDAGRFRRDFDELASIGSTGDGGVHRPALGPAHLEAREWFRRRIVEDGLELVVDGAGNHSARLRCDDPVARTLLLGSHLDSVPYGGRFDGALGVVAALEAVRTVRDADLELPLHLEAIDFTDEEGTWLPLLGSRALCGTLPRQEIETSLSQDEALRSALKRSGLTVEGLLQSAREPRTLAGFLELHIEQGPRLVASGARIGVVESIVGIRSLALVFHGRADHAGTTRLGERRDAGLGAAALVLRAEEVVRAGFEECTINFGRAALRPGALNIVPAQAELALELRAPDDARLDELESVLLELARNCAEERGLQLAHSVVASVPATACAHECRAAFHAAAERLGLRTQQLISGAGHDAMSMAAICPAGMIFVPSTGGSHSSREHAEWGDCETGANTLLHALLTSAGVAADES